MRRLPLLLIPNVSIKKCHDKSKSRISHSHVNKKSIRLIFQIPASNNSSTKPPVRISFVCFREWVRFHLMIHINESPHWMWYNLKIYYFLEQFHSIIFCCCFAVAVFTVPQWTRKKIQIIIWFLSSVHILISFSVSPIFKFHSQTNIILCLIWNSNNKISSQWEFQRLESTKKRFT